MEYRKLIAFGKSSYVISLPKAWIKRNKLKKGDNIGVEQRVDHLNLMATYKKRKEEEKRIVINVDGRPTHQISREIVSAYINNYKNIVLIGKQLVKRSSDIRGILHSLMALEIMEQTADRIIARDFLDMKDINLIGIIRRMDNVTRAMLIDTGKCFDEPQSRNIWERDQDVNRLSYLLFRSVKLIISQPDMFAKVQPPLLLLSCWQCGKFIEDIANDSKRAARTIELANFNGQIKGDLSAMFNKIEKVYSEVMKSWYTKDIKLAFKYANIKFEILAECEQLYGKYWRNKYSAKLLENFKDIITKIHNIGRLVY